MYEWDLLYTYFLLIITDVEENSYSATLLSSHQIFSWLSWISPNCFPFQHLYNLFFFSSFFFFCILSSTWFIYFFNFIVFFPFLPFNPLVLPPLCDHHTVCVQDSCPKVLFPFCWIPPPPKPHPTNSCHPALYLRVYIYFAVSSVCSLDSTISEIMRYLSFPEWRISLNIMFSRSIHTVAKGKIFFFTVE